MFSTKFSSWMTLKFLRVFISRDKKAKVNTLFFLSPTHSYVISISEVLAFTEMLYLIRRPYCDAVKVLEIRKDYFEGSFTWFEYFWKKYSTVIWKSTQFTSKKFQGKLQTFYRLVSHYTEVQIKSRNEIFQK